MSNAALKTVVMTPDGQIHNSKTEANEWLRRPKILEALAKVVGPDNPELVDWLLEQKDEILNVFDIGTIRRVTKVERKRLAKGLEAVKAIAAESGDKDLDFLVENADDIVNTFRWPGVKRLKDDEKAVAMKNSLVTLTGDNEQLADWITANKEALVEAFNAGKMKREVSPKAAEALAKYRAELAAQKAAKDAENAEVNDADDADESEGTPEQVEESE